MIIRQQQMAVLTEASRGKFEDRMVEHLNRCFPSECQALGDKGVLEAIRYGIERAASHGINLERDVCKYIDLMFAFGRDYDRDPALPWASRILQDDTFKSSTMKMERLFSEAKLQNQTATGSPLP
jgi:hypothetical protein